MKNYSALSDANVVAEVDRYITIPGQATAYKIGQLKLLELRKRVKKALKDKFDIRTFHSQLLSYGSLPLTLIEEEIERDFNLKK